MSRAPVQSIIAVEAWRSYEIAFHEFSMRVRRLQTLTEDPHPDRNAIEAALLEVEKARLIYDGFRDRLALELLPPTQRGSLSTQDSPQEISEHVKSIAEVLWESAGRPQGTAEQDWLVAEKIVKRAATAA